MRTHPILLLAVGLTWTACNDTGSPPDGGVGPSTDGTLVVSTSTGGNEPDPDGYLLTVDGVDSLVLAPTGTAEIGLPAGQHTLQLLGVAEQCSVAPAKSLEVDVPPQSTTPVAFEISCHLTGARITTTTTGLDLDLDGYRVEVDGTDRGAIPANDTVVIRLDPGSRTIALTGLSPNCTIEGPGSRTVTIVDTEVASIDFSVVCTATPASRTLAFESNGEIYVVHMDGSNLRRLTSDGWYPYDREAAWSPDGSRIALSKSDGQQGAEIYVIDADGANPTRLSLEGAYDATPTWSPDGRRIAFESRRDSTGYGGVNSWLDPEIYVMNADGTNQVRLTNHLGHNDYTPAWSPDGNRIAYVSDTVGYSHIYVINADGSNPVQLTSDEHDDSDPEWSPDGSRIVFSRSGDLFVVDADGTNLALLTPAGTHGGEPAWSPDGGMIAFTRSTNCHLDSYGEIHCDVGIWVVRVAGGSMSMFELPLQVGFARGPSWRP